MPKSFVPRQWPRWLAVACLVTSVTGCHELGGLAGAGADQSAAPGDSPAKAKHLPNFGSSQKDRGPAGEAPTSEPGEPGEASGTHHARHAAAPFYHWDDDTPAPSRHRSRSGL